MNFLRNYIKSSPRIYPFHINKIKGLNVVFPDRYTDLHLTGFPRSANTYCKQLVKEVFTDLNVVTHIHTVASIKIALRYKARIVLLLRSPLSTTSSMLMKFSYKNGGEVLYDYIKYHEFVFRNIGDIKIFRFEEVIESPIEMIYYIRSIFNLNISDEIIEKKLMIAERKSISKEKAKSPLGSSRPNTQREAKKATYRHSIVSHKLYPLAEEIYLKLQKQNEKNICP